MPDSTHVDEVAELRAEIERLKGHHDEVDVLKAQLAHLTALLTEGPQGITSTAEAAMATEKRTDRRGLLMAAGAATVGAVGAGLLNAAPSAALSLNLTYGGLYSGICVNNADPEHLGRIMATVPDVFGRNPSGWAQPNFPVGWTQVPALQQKVWIAFEGGNKDFPIWTGVWGQVVTANLP